MKAKFRSFVFLLSFLLLLGTVNAQPVKGKVVDKKSGEPIVGAVVSYSNGGILSDTQGEFSINPKIAGNQLKISLLGYRSQEIVINEKSKDFVVKLEEDSKLVDEVVVIGYGKSTKEKVTGSITTIDEKTLASYSGRSVLDVLQGRVAGLQIASKNGLPGSAASINVRGVNTIGSAFVDACGEKGCCTDPEAGNLTNTEPLIVVDGVPFINQSVSALQIGAAGATGPLATLSTSDISRIDILKDADATAIYGSRGSNGVILITTKRGLTGSEI